MKATIKNYFIALITLLSFSGFSQITDRDLIVRPLSGITSFDFGSKELVGSSYLNEDFLPAKFSYSEKVYSMRYNAYQDEMEFKKDGKPYYLLKNVNDTITFIGINKIYQVYTYKDKDKTKSGFFVVLNGGDKISLLLKEKIKFYEEVKAQSGYDKYQPPELKRIKDKIYIGYKNSTTSELPKKKKEILKLFSGKAKEVESFAKKNKFEYKKKEDLIEIVKYYNSL